MVSFRYHLVSVGAVLLALAAGVVLGAGPLSTKVSSALTPTPTTHPTASGPSLAALKASLAADDAYVAATSRTLIAGQLHRTRVVLVVAPGTPQSLTASVTRTLAQAGAVVTGSVALTPSWTDPTHATVLDGITTQLAPPSTATGTGNGAGQAAAALAAALLTRHSYALGQPSDTATALLAGLVQGGFVTRTGSPDQAASLAVFLAPATTSDPAALLPLMTALRVAGSGVVVVAPTGSAQPGAVLAAVRVDPATRVLVSTVDSGDQLTGRVALVLALAQQKAGGHGQYGFGPGADAPLPHR